ncbi:MAG TPA: alpha-glucan family phosphorylase [Casimicrobiaceae bacterium]|nr:alpha-glucan family phosphorylase [Casimicrobiaceae bacterium]
MEEPARTNYVLEVRPRIPRRLIRLRDLADNLWYTWDRPTRYLFAQLDKRLWEAVGQSPKALLNRVDEQRLVDAEDDPLYMERFSRVLLAYDAYHGESRRPAAAEQLEQRDLVAYFCAEFGFHESLPIYSGGLGILAGDHCKAASDLRLPFVGIGLLYRQGYFSQTIDSDGNQNAAYNDADFDDLPVMPVISEDGAELHVRVDLDSRQVEVKVWQAQVGHVMLYLLDTDLDSNTDADRRITHRLYGGDRATRIEQEIVLGVGGVRALAAIGLKPAVWHINEGHAAFLVLERMRQRMAAGADIGSALELVAASTVFTSHTAVPAGHDRFEPAMICRCFADLLRDTGVTEAQLLALGGADTGAEFDMTTLAVRGSRFQNGVSRIHGGVTARMLKDLWPQIPSEENPVRSITNGVHTPTFLAPEMQMLFDRYMEFAAEPPYLGASLRSGLEAIPDHLFWSVRQQLKAQLLHLVRHRVRIQHFRNHGSASHLDRLLKWVDPANPGILTIGFGRRFAQYKRATLLFDDLDRLAEIVSDPERPIVFLFAGKAHPADGPGIDAMRRVQEVARMPRFEGRILLIEGYDLRLSRRMVCGTDVWLNNPVYPLEASGTSGMKAGINGVINLSVLDGWWGEGHDGDNGWAIKPASTHLDPQQRDHEEARTLYEILQDQVIPLYHARGAMGHSPGWIAMAKRSIASVLPRFNAGRMIGEYVSDCYLPAAQLGRRYAADGAALAGLVAAWKARVRDAWPGVAIRRLDTPARRIRYGESIPLRIGINLNGLGPDDIAVEAVMTRRIGADGDDDRCVYPLAPAGPTGDGGEQAYTFDLSPELCGRLDYAIRAYPWHDALAHRFEMGLMVWA